MIVTETKLDDSYPISQFLIPGFSKPFGEDRNTNGGGIIIYVGEDISCKQLNAYFFPENIEGLFIELMIICISIVLGKPLIHRTRAMIKS